MNNKIFIASDHAGYKAKSAVTDLLKSLDYQVDDLGTCNDERVDYPLFAQALAQKVQGEEDSLGILICGSGIGVSMVANRFRGIRAALCKNALESRLSRQHNNANVLCLDGRLSDEHTREEIIKSWLEAGFEGGRHQTRIDMFDNTGVLSLEENRND